jgi:hypothetical protein
MTKQMPFLKKRYLSYQKFAEANFQSMFPGDQLIDSEKFEAELMHSVIIENLGNNKYNVRPLPMAAQFSTVNAILVDDFDEDEKLDILLAGNFYPINIQMGRNDASYGLFLKGKGNGEFNSLSQAESGFTIKGETRKLKRIIISGKPYYLAFRNNDTIEIFRMK